MLFVMATLNSLSNHSNIWDISVLASVDCLFSLKLWFSWLLIWWAIFFSFSFFLSFFFLPWVIFGCILDIFTITLWDFRSYVNLLFQQVVICLGLACRSWPVFLWCGLNDSLIFRGFAVFFGVLGLSGAAGTPTGPFWCCLRGPKGLPRSGPPDVSRWKKGTSGP